MSYRTFHSLLVLALLCTGCGVNVDNKDISNATADFITATLPPTPVQQATQTMSPPTAIPVAAPVEGTTTTQVNVRTQTSTASETLGMIGQYAKVQVIGRDASGSWFQIIYPEAEIGYGWVRAEYVQVASATEIPIVGDSTGSGSGVNGLILQKINVRSGPAVTYDSLGVLNPKDVVSIIGRDSNETWLQIEFASAPAGNGWVALEYLQVASLEAVPLVGSTDQPSATPQITESQASPVMIPAAQDGDSIEAPLAITLLSPSASRALQVNGDISAPEGDREDWIQFSAYTGAVTIQLICSSDTLASELWNDGLIENGFSLTCAETKVVSISPNSRYFLHLTESDAGEFQLTRYTLRLEAVH